MKDQLNQPDERRLPAPTCSLRHGAYCNEYGSIYLRIAAIDTSQEGWPIRAVDHGISIEEAHCIMSELVLAMHQSAMQKTGRANAQGQESPGTASNQPRKTP